MTGPGTTGAGRAGAGTAGAGAGARLQSRPRLERSAPSPRAGTGRRRPRRGRRVARALLVLLLAGLVGVGAFVGGLLAAPIDFAVPPPPRTALLLAADGSQLGTIRPPQRQEVVAAADIPDVMRQAIISAEDERFLQHKGVDLLAISRAAYRDLTGSRTQGGSTLTQQYVKNVYVRDNDKTALRKVREAALALRLEQRTGKAEILTDYLNVLYLGNGAYGVQAASRYYFGVPVKDLDLDERTGRRSPALATARASLLAGIAPAPSAWNPVRDFATARSRQVYTLNRMVANGYLSSTQASDAYRQRVRPLMEPPPESPSVAPEFAGLVKSELRSQFKGDPGADVLFRSGLRVRTTLDVELQAALSKAMREVLPDATDPEAAAVAVDPRTGDVKAMTTLRRVPAVEDRNGKLVRKAVSGYGRGNGQSEFNLATNAHRSTGSTIKAFTLAVALREGHGLQETRFAPSCDRMPDPGAKGGVYRYCNAEPGSGTQTLESALYRSVNTVFVPLAIGVGRSKVKQLMLDAGVEASPPFSTAPKSFAEVRGGAEGSSPGQMLPSAATDVRHTRVLPTGVADDVAQAMSQVVVRGTAPTARQDFTVYAKTGTTNDSEDAWFIGCARAPQNLCIAIWMGYEYKQCRLGSGARQLRVRGGACGGMKGLHGVQQVYGGTLPAEIFSRTFANLARAGRGAAAPPGSRP